MLTTMLILTIWIAASLFFALIACMLSARISQEVLSDRSFAPFLNNESEDLYENPPCFDSWK